MNDSNVNTATSHPSGNGTLAVVATEVDQRPYKHKGPWYDGQRAHVAGTPREKNPHPAGSAAAADWLDGYEESVFYGGWGNYTLHDREEPELVGPQLPPRLNLVLAPLDVVERLLTQAGYQPDSSARHNLSIARSQAVELFKSLPAK